MIGITCKQTVKVFLNYFNYLFYTRQDPTNLQRKVQKHEAFNAELQANQSRIDSIHDKGKQLINNEHYASDVIEKRLEELDEMWKNLLEKTQEKGKITLIFFISQTGVCRDAHQVGYNDQTESLQNKQVSHFITQPDVTPPKLSNFFYPL